ncbi:MAG: GGDEF domain-containing protein [Thermaerobacter sp.]|nr:GGDEF domain-containing protein [Thermaerobacter sp.]
MWNALWMALQPIVSLPTGYVVGHEALVRGPADSPLATPAGIFAEARNTGAEALVEAKCRQLAIAALFDRLPAGQTLFLNVDLTLPNIPLDPLGRSLDSGRIAVEISERTPIFRGSAALAQIAAWRGAGYRIVLDDYGAGYASLGMAITVHPHILKLDRDLIADVDHDSFRYDVLRSMVAMWHDKHVKVLAEGIETPEELAALMTLGVDYGQGYLLGHPAREVVVGTIPGWDRLAARSSPATAFSLSSPLKRLLQWTDADQAAWWRYGPALHAIQQTFRNSARPLLSSVLPEGSAAEDALLEQYGTLLAQDPRLPEVREKARQLGRGHIRTGLSPSWYAILYNLYFQAYHEVQLQRPDIELPPLPMFRRRWLWDLAETLDAYDDSLLSQLGELTHRVADLTQLAYQDALTGLPNRRGLEHAWERHAAHAPLEPGALLILDVDDFKNVAEQQGPQSGDAVLRAIGQRLSEHFPEPFLVARVGGDEFGLWLPGLLHIREFKPALRRATAATTAAHGLTLSGGVAWYPRQNTRFQELFFQANRALRVAKTHGKQSVVDSHSNRRYRLGDLNSTLSEESPVS